MSVWHPAQCDLSGWYAKIESFSHQHPDSAIPPFVISDNLIEIPVTQGQEKSNSLKNLHSVWRRVHCTEMNNITNMYTIFVKILWSEIEDIYCCLFYEMIHVDIFLHFNFKLRLMISIWIFEIPFIINCVYKGVYNLAFPLIRLISIDLSQIHKGVCLRIFLTVCLNGSCLSPI